jgi:hypothetical protein
LGRGAYQGCERRQVDREVGRSASRPSVLNTTLVRHALILPLWGVRAAATPLQNGVGISALIALDVALAFLHWRANRVSEVADPTNFGVKRSWTKFLYMPELLAVWMLVLDGQQAYLVYRKAATLWH